MTLRVFCFRLLWAVILNSRFSVTEFVGWGLWLIVLKTFSDSGGIGTHAHTPVPEFSTADFLEPGALDRSAILPGFRRHNFSFDLWPFHWVNFSIPRCNLLNGLCHPFQKVFVQTHAYFRDPHVFAGYLLFCALLNRPAINHGWRCASFVFFCFGLSPWISVSVWQNLPADGSVLSCSKRFPTVVAFEPAHTLVYQNFWLRIFFNLQPSTTRPSCLVSVDTFFPFALCPFNWRTFSIQRCNLLNCLCYPFGKICI